MTITGQFLTHMADKISPFIADLGAKVLHIYNGDFDIHLKPDNSPFTIADTLTEQKIVAFLRHHTPHIPIYAEESFTHFPAQMPTTFWLVDPIDGTKGFIKRNNIFTLNIGLIHRRQPVFGVVHDPQNTHTFIGFALNENDLKNKRKPPVSITPSPLPNTIDESYTKDIYTALSTDLPTPLWGAYKNNTRIQCSPITQPLTIATNADTTAQPIASFLQPYIIDTVLAYTSSIKICMVASGEADMYPRWGRCYEWDTAAGDAVLRGAGGTTCDMQGTPLLYGKPKLLNTAFLCLGRL